MKDTEFLALLVHRGHFDAERARALVGELRGGRRLDELLIDGGLAPDEVARLRRTRGGEMPELPGYRIEKRLGVGGTADVFRAKPVNGGEAVALKVLRPDSTLHTPTRKAFIAEARLLEKLEHPALVRCFGIARSGNTYFSRLELIPGRTLLEVLEERGEGLAEDEALTVVVEAAKALAYLSSQGVVHRDVKPGNLMVDERDGRIVLIDLGFAASPVATPEQPAADQAVGTVAYLSPEAAAGGAAADVRSDIYSLGLSLFHLVVGKLPFDADDDQDVLRRKVMESLSSPELLRRRVSPHVQYFVEKMVAHDAADRYQSFDELIRDVEAQIAGREALQLFRRR